MLNRVCAIVDIAAVSALGESWPDIWRRLVAGEDAVIRTSALSGLDIVDVPVAAVQHLDRSLSPQGEGPARRLLARVMRSFEEDAPEHAYGGSNHGEACLLLALRDGPTSAQARALVEDTMPRYGKHGMRWTYSACSSGLHALISGVLDIEDGHNGDVLVAAADVLSVIEIVGFRRLGAVSAGRARPFHEDRDGILMGEGAAAVRLKRVQDSPGSPVKVLGLSMSCDASHPTDPEPTGEHLERAIRSALQSSGMTPRDIVAVIAHGTGTSKNDLVEASVIRRVWGTEGVPITSVKGSLGHTMGASGLFNVLVGVTACRAGLLPPITADEPEMLPGLTFVVGKPRSIPPGRPLVVLASGFGGNHAAIVLGSE